MMASDNMQSAGLPPSADFPAQILVLDDEPGIRRGCQRVLSAEGHQVWTAASVEEALQIMRTHPELAVALVDLRMPGGPPEMPEMGGMAFLSAAQAEAPLLVCNVITAYATIETAIEATRRGAYDILPKPFTADELLRVVQKALQHHRLLREHQRLQAERERRLLELATEQSRLRGIINCMADAVLVCNAADELVLYNPAALRLLRGVQPGREAHPLAEVLASRELLELIYEGRTTQGWLSREILLEEGPPPAWGLANVTPVTEAKSGAFLGTVTVVRDITELHQIEQIKAQFVNMVAHELRAPLAAIDGYLAVLHEGLVPSEEKRKEMIARSRQRLQALLELVNDLLAVARMEAKTVQRQIQPQSLPQILEEAVELLQPMAQQAEVTLELEASSELPTVEADREELLRLFTNLISNGIKYNRPGGKVRIAAAAEGPYVRVAVADTGIGISPENIPYLFSEFFREKRRETARVTGTGLGLSIVKRIVDFYHGRVEVQSQVGEGTTFTVWLPCQLVPASVD